MRSSVPSWCASSSKTLPKNSAVSVSGSMSMRTCLLNLTPGFSSTMSRLSLVSHVEEDRVVVIGVGPFLCGLADGLHLDQLEVEVHVGALDLGQTGMALQLGEL